MRVCRPEYLAFGSFGCVAGHELSHAFDQAGRLYNKDGKLEDWWTNVSRIAQACTALYDNLLVRRLQKTTSRFEHLQQCILDQYSQYAIKGDDGQKHYIRSHLTNGEDMADAGGIEQAYRAWQDRWKSDMSGDKFDNYLLPGVEYSREQLFFIAYAQGWRRNIKPAEAVKRIRTDPHSPTNFRGEYDLWCDEALVADGAISCQSLALSRTTRPLARRSIAKSGSQ